MYKEGRKHGKERQKEGGKQVNVIRGWEGKKEGKEEGKKGKKNIRK